MSENELQEAAIQSGVLDAADDFIDLALRRRCENVIPNPTEILPEDCCTAYIRLKENGFLVIVYMHAFVTIHKLLLYKH